MAVSSDPSFAKKQTAEVAGASHTRSKSIPFKAMMKRSAHPRASLDTSSTAVEHTADTSIEFSGDLNTNNDLPTRETLKQVEDFPILDQDGKAVPFKTLYTGPNVARRVLIIFIRHFFCGVCLPSPSLSIYLLTECK
jgi:hypothetical protein